MATQPQGAQGSDADLVATLVDLGVDAEAAADYVRRGNPEAAVFEAVLLPYRRERTVTPAAIAADGGLDVQAIGEMMQAFGLPLPSADEPVFTPAEGRVFVELAGLGEVWPPETRVRIARAYGAMLGAIARIEFQAFETQAAPRIRKYAGDPAGELSEVQAVAARLLPLADPLLVGIHRRRVEAELAQGAVRAAENRVAHAALPGAADVTFLFCDLKDFTAFAEEKGDAAALLAIDRLFGAIAREQGEHGRLVKSLGDGAMLVYDDPSEAVAAGARVIDAVRTPPAVHASVHRGSAIERAGDYFGGSVNVAARLLPFASAGELVASDPAVEGSRDRFEWEALGDQPLRGVSRPVSVFRLAGAADEQGDASASGTR